MKLAELATGIAAKVAANSPAILAGTAIVGVVMTAVFAVKGCPKAKEAIDECKEEIRNFKGDTDGKEETPEQKKYIRKIIGRYVKKFILAMIPTVVTFALTAACILGGHTIQARRTAALAAAYNITESAFKDYKDKVKEIVGEKKEEAIRDEIAKDKVDAAPVSGREVYITGKGDQLCFDKGTGRYFNSSIEEIRRCVNDLNFRLRQEMFISLNDFYYALGLKPVDLGDILGWDIDKGEIEVTFSSQIADDGRPALVLEYNIGVKYGYGDLWSK